MGFWRRLLGGSTPDDVKPQRLDYLNEALALERQGDYDSALTSYRLALRDHPNDARILQNMAIAFTKTRRVDEAIRHYRRALELDRELAGAHYGLAFLLLKRGDPDGATQHLRAFLAHPPKGPDAQKWIEHATVALRDLGASGGGADARRCGGGALTGRPHARGRAGVVIFVVAAALGCGIFSPPDLNRVFAIELIAPDSLEELDTLRPRARALDGHFDSIAATFVWSTLDTAILTVLDSTTGRTVVNHPGVTPGRLLARTGSMFSNPLLIRPLATADTVYPTPLTRVADTVHLSVDSLSDSLAVQIADTIESASGGDSVTVPLAGRPIAYAITFPASAGSVTLVTSDTAHRLVTSDTVASGTQGIASVKVRLIAGPAPDSVLVTASAHRAVGTAVPGSPVTFVVRFEP